MGARATTFLAAMALLAACGHNPPPETQAPPLGDDASPYSDDGGAVPEGGFFSDASGCSSPGDAAFFPASHPPPPTEESAGGPILEQPTVTPIFFSGDDSNVETLVGNFLTALSASPYWTEVTSEYGVGGLMVYPAIQLPVSAPPAVQDADVQTLLLTALNGDNSTFPTPADGTILAVLYPSGTSITDSSGLASCVDFGGYHGSIQLDAAHGSQNVGYIVLPRCSSFDGLTDTDALTASLSHELIESATDPFSSNPAYNGPDDAHAFWPLALGGGEVTDMCGQTNASYVEAIPPYWVARSWSNASAAAGHDPCLPTTPCTAYFASVPVLTDSVMIDSVTMPDVHIPAGQTGTIELDLFSDGPTSGPWSVAVTQVNGDPSTVGQLGFSLDESSGQNGDVLHLSITVQQASEVEIEPFYVFSTLGRQQSVWIGLVGN
jgi:hypothetical protein